MTLSPATRALLEELDGCLEAELNASIEVAANEHLGKLVIAQDHWKQLKEELEKL